MVKIESKTNKEAIDSIYKNGADGDWVIDLKPGYITQYGTTYIKNKHKKDCLEELKDVVKENNLEQKQENFNLFKEAYELHDTLNPKLFDLETSKLKSEVLEKLLKSAIANAENNHGMKSNKLYVAEIYANQGPTLRRIRPAAKGSAVRIRKRTSHITIVLKERD